VNVFDRGKKRLIWRGDASKTTSRKTQVLQNALQKNNWNRSRVARYLGVTRDTLNYRIPNYELAWCPSGFTGNRPGTVGGGVYEERTSIADAGPSASPLSVG
jgi:hypothetical protein